MAYGSGHIRLFSVHPTAAMLVEVAAHARWITALDLAPDSGRLLSVGEDSLVRVWQIREDQPMVIVKIFLNMTRKIIFIL